MKILNDIPVKLETTEVMQSLKLNVSASSAVKKIDDLIESITPVMRPKAIYTKCNVEDTQSDMVTIDGYCFKSKVLAKNLVDQDECYPYIVTAGQELEKIELPKEQSLMLLDLIKNIVVGKAFDYTRDLIVEQYSVRDISGMSPGHLDDWQLDQQQVLFDLLGPDIDKIGVRLTPSYLMLPVKTVSGIWFTSETGFQSCQVCTQPRCMGRKLDYDPLVAKTYGL